MRLFKRLGIDLGTSNTVIWTEGEGIVLNESTMVAVALEDKQLLAAGEEAKKMSGKTPDYIEVIRPMNEGVVADFEVTVAMMRYFLRKVMGKLWMFGPEVLVSVPSGATEVELRAVIDAILAAGARKVNLIDEPLAAAIGAKIPIAESFGNMVVSVGGGSTEVAVIALGGVVAHSSIRVGGDRIDEAIVSYLRKKHNLLVGEQTAEAIKIKLGSAVKLKRPETMEVSGRDVVNGLPKNEVVDSDGVYEAILGVLEVIVGAVRQTLEVTPPELVSDVADRGIVLCGGSVQLRGFDTLMTREIGVSTHVVSEPQMAVIRGVGMAVENLEIYRQALR
ncbi:MAG: rod shape-determining protein [Candidatus Shapirobacteria bacterium]|jgi:rod shape-determining protein MreB